MQTRKNKELRRKNKEEKMRKNKTRENITSRMGGFQNF